MPARTIIKHLEEEIQQLKEAQDRTMSLAVFVGMTAAEVKETDKRRKRIYELYEELLKLRKQYRKASPSER